MNMWMMYLVLKLDSIIKFLGFLSIGTFVVVALLMLITIVAHCEDIVKEAAIGEMWKSLKLFVFIAIIPLILFVLMPTTKQAAAIYFVPKVINNKQVRKMPDKLMTLANDWMDEQIKTIKRKKNA